MLDSGRLLLDHTGICFVFKRIEHVLMYATSFSNIKKMEPLIDARMYDWINKLSDSFAQTGKKFDFAPCKPPRANYFATND